MTKQLILTKDEITEWVVTSSLHVINEFSDEPLEARWDTDLDGNDIVVVQPKS